MPYCLRCHQEYAAGTETCPECGHLLQNGRPSWRSYKRDEPLVLVHTAQGELQAELVKGQLEQEGIPVFIQRESIGVVYGLTIDGLGAQRLMVPESLSEAAKDILAAYAEPGSPDQEEGREEESAEP